MAVPIGLERVRTDDARVPSLWWFGAGVNVDPVPIALELWRRSLSGGAHSGTLFGLSSVTSLHGAISEVIR